MSDGLAEIGFELVQRSKDGTQRYAKRSHPYLVLWLNVYASGEAELTWEFSLGQYLRDKGFFVSGQDELSLLLFPREEQRGAADADWAAEAAERVERTLASLDFARGT